MDQQFLEARRLIVDCRNMLETLESASTNVQLDPAASSPVAQSFQQSLSQLNSVGHELRRQMTSEPPSRRQVWKARLRDLDDQIAELRSGEARCAMRLRHIAREKQMRDDLLQRRPQMTPNGTHASHSTVIGLMDAGEEARRLDDSTNIAGNILGTGRNALNSLMSQREKLRGARKKMLDVLHQIGVDRALIARIERRERSDLILMYALMIGMLGLLGLAVLWKHYWRKRA